MKARAAGVCHQAMKMSSSGITESATTASSGSSQNRKPTISASPIASARMLRKPVVISSCSVTTSEVTRDMMRPTSSRS